MADLGLIVFITVSRVRSRVAGWVNFLGNGAAILLALGNLMYRAEAIPAPRLFRLGSFSRQSSLPSCSSRAGWPVNSSSGTASASSTARMKVVGPIVRDTEGSMPEHLATQSWSKRKCQ